MGEDPLRLESQCVNGDIVSDMLMRQELRCLQCKADLTKQGHEWLCSHHPTAPVCEECGENLRANGHKGTCSHSVMRGGSPMPTVRFGDIRDMLVALPHGEPFGATAYVRSDVFTVRHELIRQLEPAPTGVFEFGALYGYFLVTALDAAPSIERVGWVDNEQHTPGSNVMCYANVQTRLGGRDFHWFDIRFDTSRDTVASHTSVDLASDVTYDLISVDSDHSYDGCLADLHAAHRLNPRWIFVDDWTSETHWADIAQAVFEFMKATEYVYDLEAHVTVNGLAVLTRKEHA